MTREVKFRGKRVDNDKWEFGIVAELDVYEHERCDYLKETVILRHIKYDDGGYYVEAFIYANEVIPETVGQYTGLKDKNGIEIYEGDVVYGENIDDDILWVWYGVVKFNNYRLMFQELKTEKWYEIDDFQFDEVIGNIYDTPGLMEGGE